MERVTTYMYTGRSWGGSACGRDRKRRVVHKETKCACFAVGVVCEVSVREPHDREIDVWGDVLCVWERYTLHSACAWEREMPEDLAREWGKRCVHAQETK